MNTLKAITDVVEKYFNLRRGSCQKNTKKRDIVTARQISMYFARKYDVASLAKIGAFIGGKDHATVLHAKRTVEDLMFSSRKFREDIEALEPKIRRIFDHQEKLRKKQEERMKFNLLNQIREISGYEHIVNMRIALNELCSNRMDLKAF
jgi:hypothetical protein